MLIQFEKEICFGYTGSEWIKEKLNTFEISIFLDWSFIKRKQLCNVWERRMVFLWSWCWLGLESGKCKWWLWFDFFYSNICKLPQEVCMLEFFSLCVFFFFFAVVVVVVVFFSTCLFDVVLVFGSFLKEILYKKSTNHPWCTIVGGHLSVEDCILCCYSIMLKKCTILIDLILSVT